MPKYRAKVKMLISHESRVVEAGEEFEATFPEGMRLGENLELVEPEHKVKAKAGKAPTGDESLT